MFTDFCFFTIWFARIIHISFKILSIPGKKKKTKKKKIEDSSQSCSIKLSSANSTCLLLSSCFLYQRRVKYNSFFSLSTKLQSLYHFKCSYHERPLSQSKHMLESMFQYRYNNNLVCILQTVESDLKLSVLPSCYSPPSANFIVHVSSESSHQYYWSQMFFSFYSLSLKERIPFTSTDVIWRCS